MPRVKDLYYSRIGFGLCELAPADHYLGSPCFTVPQNCSCPKFGATKYLPVFPTVLSLSHLG